MVPRKSVEVTPTSVQRDGDVWRVRFVKGDQGSDDEDLFLSRCIAARRRTANPLRKPVRNATGLGPP